MFQFPSFALSWLLNSPCSDLVSLLAGLPHSEIHESKHAWSLVVAYRYLANVLHRLLLPRYPPYTLNSFICLDINKNFNLILDAGSRLLSNPVMWFLKILENIDKKKPYEDDQNRRRLIGFAFSFKRRWSSRRFPYGYLVTTSPQSWTIPW